MFHPTRLDSPAPPPSKIPFTSCFKFHARRISSRSRGRKGRKEERNLLHLLGFKCSSLISCHSTCLQVPSRCRAVENVSFQFHALIAWTNSYNTRQSPQIYTFIPTSHPKISNLVHLGAYQERLSTLCWRNLVHCLDPLHSGKASIEKVGQDPDNIHTMYSVSLFLLLAGSIHPEGIQAAGGRLSRRQSSSPVDLWGACNYPSQGINGPLPCASGSECICKDDSKNTPHIRSVILFEITRITFYGRLC